MDSHGPVKSVVSSAVESVVFPGVELVVFSEVESADSVVSSGIELIIVFSGVEFVVESGH